MQTKLPPNNLTVRKTACRADLLRHFITTKEPNVIDVGANSGQTIDDVLSLFPDATVWSFEPDPYLYQKLTGMYVQSNVRLYPFAVSKEVGEKNLNRYSQSEANSFYDIDPEGYYGSRNIELLEKSTVTCTTVDIFVAEQAIDHVDFLKIDTQGHSLEVIQGARGTLQLGNVGCLQVEFNVYGLYTKADDFVSALMFLRECGYELYALMNGDSEQIGHLWHDFYSGRLCAFDAFFVHKSLLCL